MWTAEVENSVVAAVKKLHHCAVAHGFNFRSTDSANRGRAALGRTPLFHAFAYAALATGLGRARAAVAGIVPCVAWRNEITLRHRCPPRTNEQFRLLHHGCGLDGDSRARALANARMDVRRQLHARDRAQVESLADGFRVSIGLDCARHVDLGLLAAWHVRQPRLHADECVAGHSNRVTHRNARDCLCGYPLRFDARDRFVSREQESASGAGLRCTGIDPDGSGRVRRGAPNEKSLCDSDDGDRTGRDR